MIAFDPDDAGDGIRVVLIRDGVFELEMKGGIHEQTLHRLGFLTTSDTRNHHLVVGTRDELVNAAEACTRTRR